MQNRILIFFMVVLCLLVKHGTAQSRSLTGKELRTITGKWKGSLTYLDYSSNKSFTMPADVDIIYLPKLSSLVLSNSYPNEPKANSKDTIIISAKGSQVNEKPIISKTKKPNGEIEVTTETKGVDGNENKAALIRYVYVLGKQQFIIRKDVQFDGSNDWINRHQFTYYR